jgi:hypothetical protein
MFFLALYAMLNNGSSSRIVELALFYLIVAGFAAATSVRKYAKAKSKEAESLKKISSFCVSAQHRRRLPKPSIVESAKKLPQFSKKTTRKAHTFRVMFRTGAPAHWLMLCEKKV